MPLINLDTHVLVHALTEGLRTRERQLLTTRQWGVSAIVLWEMARLAQRGWITVDLDDLDVREVLASIHVWPLDLDVTLQSTRLDSQAGPADELIAATSVVHRVPLLTRDRTIRKSRMVPLAWAVLLWPGAGVAAARYVAQDCDQPHGPHHGTRPSLSSSDCGRSSPILLSNSSGSFSIA